jgi:hypothetical protein
VSSVAVGQYHVLALAEDGLVYAWGENRWQARLGNPDVERQLLPKPARGQRRRWRVSQLRSIRHGRAVGVGMFECARRSARPRHKQPLPGAQANGVVAVRQGGCGGRRRVSHAGASRRRKSVLMGR